MRPIVHSVKHYRQITLTTVTTGTRNLDVLCTAVESTVANLENEIEEGALVKAIYIELWLIGNTADQFFTITVSKDPSGHAGSTFTEMTTLFTYDNKKNILYTTQGLAPNDGVGQPIPVIRQWFKIPKGKQRFGLGDKLRLAVASRGDGTITMCGFATYKEYS